MKYVTVTLEPVKEWLPVTRSDRKPATNCEDWERKAAKHKATRERRQKMRQLYFWRYKVEMFTRRIEILEDELDLLGWNPRHNENRMAKIPYSDRFVKELCALPLKERSRRIKDLAAQKGISFRSVYRNLEKCPAWSLRRRVNPTEELRQLPEPTHSRQIRCAATH